MDTASQAKEKEYEACSDVHDKIRDRLTALHLEKAELQSQIHKKSLDRL